MEREVEYGHKKNRLKEKEKILCGKGKCGVFGLYVDEEFTTGKKEEETQGEKRKKIEKKRFMIIC